MSWKLFVQTLACFMLSIAFELGIYISRQVLGSVAYWNGYASWKLGYDSLVEPCFGGYRGGEAFQGISDKKFRYFMACNGQHDAIWGKNEGTALFLFLFAIIVGYFLIRFVHHLILTCPWSMNKPETSTPTVSIEYLGRLKAALKRTQDASTKGEHENALLTDKADSLGKKLTLERERYERLEHNKNQQKLELENTKCSLEHTEFELQKIKAFVSQQLQLSDIDSVERLQSKLQRLKNENRTLEQDAKEARDSQETSSTKLRAEMKYLKINNEQLLQQNVDLKSGKRKTSDQSNQELKDLRSEKVTNVKTINRLNEENANLKGELARKKEELATSRSETATKASTIHSLTQAGIDFEADLTTKDAEIANLKKTIQDITSQKEKLQSKVEKQNKLIANGTKQLEQLNSLVNKQESARVNELSSKINTLEGTIGRGTTQLNALRSTNEGLRDTINTLQATIDQRSMEVSRLTSTIADLNRSNEECNATINRGNDQVNNLQSIIADLKRGIANRDGQISQKTTLIGNLQTQITQSTSIDVPNLESQVAQLQAEIGTLKDENADLTRKRDIAVRGKASAEEDFNNEQDEHNDTKREYNELLEEEEEQRNRATELESSLKEAEEKCEQYKENLVNRIKKQQELQVEINNLRTACKGHEDELARLRTSGGTQPFAFSFAHNSDEKMD